MEIRYEEKIPIEDYLRLRASVGWLPMARKQAENAVGKCFILFAHMMETE